MKELCLGRKIAYGWRNGEGCGKTEYWNAKSNRLRGGRTDGIGKWNGRWNDGMME